MTSTVKGIVAQAEQIMEANRSAFEPSTFEALKRAVASLAHELSHEESTLNPKSLKQMLRFLSRHPEFRLPRICIAPNEYLSISWRAARDRLVTMEFRPDGMVNWLVFAPPAIGGAEMERVEGICVTSVVMERIAAFGMTELLQQDEGDG